MKRVNPWVALALALIAPATMAEDEAAMTSVTVLAQQRGIELETLVAGEQLWVPADRLEEVSGFVLKEEGICNDGSCYPVPEDSAG